MSLVDKFNELIQDDWKLHREGAYLIVRESNQTSNPLLKVTGSKAIGFSLDKSGAKPWPFLKPLEGIQKVCDGIIVTEIERRAYIFAIEMKSGNTTKAGKQIHNTWLLVEWFKGLLRLHNHWNKDWCFCGVISSTPRRQERKGTSRHVPPMQVLRDPKKYTTIHLMNQQKLNLVDLNNALEAA